MKFNLWLYPALAVLIVGSWIGWQKKSAAALESDISILTGRIRETRAWEEHQHKSYKTEGKARQDKDKKIDWKDLALKMGRLRNGVMPDMRAIMRVQSLLVEMSAGELAVQLDDISKLDLDEAGRQQLESMIFGALVEKDPKLALDRYAGQIGEGDMNKQFMLSHAFGLWADKQPAAAAAWFDQLDQQGKFDSKSLDGKSQSRLRFEGALVSTLLLSDPRAASARVAALPEDQRQDLLQQGRLKPGSEAAYAQLVRANLPEDKASGVIANAAGSLIYGDGYERVDAFISQTGASDGEKSAIVAQVMNNKLFQNDSAINQDTLDKARAWAATQSPGTVDEATGKALAQSLWRGADFDKASALALHYQESGGKDDVIIAFLQSAASNGISADHIDKAKALIDKIQDPARQEEMRNLPRFKP